MYMDAVREIQKLEEQMEQAKADARAQAKDALTAVEKDGRALLAATRQTIREADAAAMADCEARAARQREDVLRSAEAQCQALCQQAGSRMDEAVSQIVGRVVGR